MRWAWRGSDGRPGQQLGFGRDWRHRSGGTRGLLGGLSMGRVTLEKVTDVLFIISLNAAFVFTVYVFVEIAGDRY